MFSPESVLYSHRQLPSTSTEDSLCAASQTAKDGRQVTVNCGPSGQVLVVNRFQRQNIRQTIALSPRQAQSSETGSTRQQGAGGLCLVSLCHH
jgi:hypothetical protein